MKRSTTLPVLTVLIGALLSTQPAGAQMLRFVDNIRTCQGRAPCYSTIMDAVNAAEPFDTIAVFPGVYREAVVFEGAAKGDITLRSHCGVKRDGDIERDGEPESEITHRSHCDVQAVIAPPSGDGVAILAAPRVRVLNFIIEAQTTGVSIGGPGSSGYVIHGNRVNGVRSQAARDGAVRDNTFVDAGLSGDLNASVIEGNTFFDAGILLGEGAQRPEDNLIRHNVLRGGGIDLNAPASGNTIVFNFVSGSAGDGISIGMPLLGGINVIQDNTSTGNTGCDINDRSGGGGNTWTNNRFGTKCGAATD